MSQGKQSSYWGRKWLLNLLINLTDDCSSTINCANSVSVAPPTNKNTKSNHVLGGTASPVLTATGLVYGEFLPNATPRESTPVNRSHSRTVVRECCKGDDQSQWETEIFDPPPPKNPLSDVHQNLCRWLGRWHLPACKILYKSVQGFGSAHAWFRAPWHKVTRLFFGTWERLPPRRAHRFWRKIRQTTRFRARKCLLGVAKPKSKVWPQFS